MNWLSARDVAAAIGVARSTLYGLMANHGLPRPLKIGGRRLWRPEEVQAWLDARDAARHG